MKCDTRIRLSEFAYFLDDTLSLFDISKWSITLYRYASYRFQLSSTCKHHDMLIGQCNGHNIMHSRYNSLRFKSFKTPSHTTKLSQMAE